MSDSLEDRLARLRPAEPRPALMGQLRAARPQPEPARTPWLSWIAGGAGIAAGLMVAATLWPHASPPTSSPLATVNPAPTVEPDRVFRPVESRNHLVLARDLGVVPGKGDRPVKLMEYYWVDDDMYRGDDGVSTLRMTRGRAQIVPVALETY